LIRLCEAFPVQVWFNGQPIPRPLADPSIQWKETPMGKVLLDLSVSRTKWRCFLQGLPIGKSPSYGEHQIVLLPDETLAKLPDRQYLLNETEDHRRIQAAIDSAFRAALIEAKRILSANHFVLHYARICLDSSNADLLNDLPFVPKSWFRDWEMNPAGFIRYWDRCSTDGIVAREALEDTGVWRIETGDDDNAPTAEVYLEARQAFLLQESVKVDPGHWLMGLIRTITPEDIQVHNGACIHRDANPELADDEVELELVDRLSVGLSGEPGFAVTAIRKGSTLYVTPDACNVTDLVCDYIFDDCYNEEREDEDENTIATFIAVGCSPSPDRVVLALLPWALRHMAQPKLAGAVVHHHGKAFL
jgi:hypothetical protein